MIEIRIDEPGAGEWIVERVQGFFRPGVDHSFASFEDGHILGGFVTFGYMRSSMTVHMAAEDKRWFSRRLAGLVFGYAFNQLGLKKLLAPVSSANGHSLQLCMRSGWSYEAIIKDALDGADLIILTMTRETCPWLKYAALARKAA